MANRVHEDLRILAFGQAWVAFSSARPESTPTNRERVHQKGGSDQGIFNR